MAHLDVVLAQILVLCVDDEAHIDTLVLEEHLQPHVSQVRRVHRVWGEGVVDLLLRERRLVTVEVQLHPLGEHLDEIDEIDELLASGARDRGRDQIGIGRLLGRFGRGRVRVLEPDFDGVAVLHRRRHGGTAHDEVALPFSLAFEAIVGHADRVAHAAEQVHGRG